MKAKTVNESLNEARVSSRGKKTDDILQFIEDAGPEGRGYTEIVRFAYEYTHGDGTYDADTTPTKTQKYTDDRSGKEHKYRSGGGNPHRGYWSGGFKTPTPDDRGFGHLMKYIVKNEKGNWILRDDVMTDDEADFHGKRVTYSDGGYKPEKYKGTGWKNPRFDDQGNFRPRVNQRYYDSEKATGRDVSGMDIDDGSEESFYDDDTGEETKFTRKRK